MELGTYNYFNFNVVLIENNNIVLYFIYSHPKYKAALKEKLPFLVCGSTEDQTTATAGDKASEN